jgi:hypothetical protein
MSLLATNYKIITGEDLAELFVPLANYDSGTFNINLGLAFKGLNSNYWNMNNGVDPSDNNITFCSFTIDPSENPTRDPSGNSVGNIVSVGVDDRYASFIQFTEPGTYTFELSLQGIRGYNPEDPYYLTTYIRFFNNSKDESASSSPTLNILSASYNGNSAKDDVTTTSANDNNLTYMYNNNSSNGYPVFRAFTLFNGSGQCFYNLTTLSITFKLTESDFSSTNITYKIYPQWTGDITVYNNPWIFEGNWKVTKNYG